MPDYFEPQERVRNLIYAMEAVIDMLSKVDSSSDAYGTLHTNLEDLGILLVKTFKPVELKTQAEGE